MTLGFRHHLQATPSDRIREELAKAVALLRTALQRVERSANSSGSASQSSRVIVARQQRHQRRGVPGCIFWHLSRASIATRHPGFSARAAWAVAIGSSFAPPPSQKAEYATGPVLALPGHSISVERLDPSDQFVLGHF
jgi:hypothetical protein